MPWGLTSNRATFLAQPEISMKTIFFTLSSFSLEPEILITSSLNHIVDSSLTHNPHPSKFSWVDFFSPLH